MNYHHKKTIIQTCKTARYSLIGLLSLLVVTSCTKPKNQHKPAPEQGENSTTLSNQQMDSPIAKNIPELKEKFGFFGEDADHIVKPADYLASFASLCENKTRSNGQVYTKIPRVKGFEQLAKTHKPHGYAAGLFKEFITRPVNVGKSDCKKDPRFFVIYQYVLFTEAIDKILNDKIAGDEKINQIKKALEDFKAETNNVRSAALSGGRKIQLKEGEVAYFEPMPPVTDQGTSPKFDESDYRLSTGFTAKLDKIVFYLDDCVAKNEALIKGNS